MKLPKLLVRKKLRASTARRSFSEPEEMDYEEMSEPNMKLSRALLIVLVLHVVAVAGIIAFNTIKSRQGAFPAPKTAAVPAKVETAPASAAKIDPSAAPAIAQTNSAKTSQAPGKIAKDETQTAARALPVTSESGNFYVIAKGDNPVKIAKKLKVSESELLAVNHIDDPRKLQIGQRLIVPAKAAKKKSTEN